ncbi:hypothetical protein [Rhizobium sp. CF142]|uniref:hypothetical protein n=1 Tax=Rhizobium sp. CF142 TaxID=1144314 RepID=UPI00026EEF02|nr:hypothetical protein [Rhizobium sp. CF142]EJJ29660.1 hypothetical protein PMI11_02141 [Rhizobium sp. CF142]
MEAAISKLFERYERFFRQALAAKADMDEVASLYASDVIAASPVGIMSGKNDEELERMTTPGFEQA